MRSILFRTRKKLYALISLVLLIAITSAALAGCGGSFKKNDIDATDPPADTETGAPSGDKKEDEPENINVTRGDDGRLVLWDESEGFPVKVLYSFLGCFDHFSYQTENEELIKALVKALRGLEISDRNGSAAVTADTMLVFTMANGKTYSAYFTGSNFEDPSVTTAFGSKIYNTKGFDAVSTVLSEIAEQEKNLLEREIASAVPDGNGRIALWNSDVSPVSVTYYYDESYGVVASAWTDDGGIIDRLTDALGKIKVGDVVRKSNYDSFGMLEFKLNDGSYYEVNFYSELFSTVSGSITYYETEGFEELKSIMDEIAAQDKSE